MINILIITLITIILESSSLSIDIVSLDDGCYMYQECKGVYFLDEGYAESFRSTNSSVRTEENESSLGRLIAECYINPLCFELNVLYNANK